MTAIAVTIAGSDSGGGAGIQADLKTFAALGVYGASAITALTAQNTQGVQGVHDVPAAFVTAQLDSVFSDLAIAAVKIGMVSRADTIAAIADGLSRHGAARVVLDPVMIATSGDRLLSPDAIDALRGRLFPLAVVATPNLPEAAELLGARLARNGDEAAEQGRRLLAFGCRAVLVKGGHGNGPESVDLLVDAAGVRRFAAPRHLTRNTHGTGCTLSAAIAAHLALGRGLDDAVGAAKTYLTGALIAADRLRIGSGAGPVHHMYHRDGSGDP